MSAPVGIDERARELLEGIGRTPLAEIEGFEVAHGSRVFAKLESTNPGGSIKDRPVARMLLAGLREGRLAGGRRLLDSSSGNAGIAYAMIGARLGIPVTLVVPGNASRERLERIRAHGAELVLTDPIEGYDFAVREAQRLARENPERYWHCDQYSNPENWRAHYETTGAEILTQVIERAGSPPDVFVAGVGTGGDHRRRPPPPGGQSPAPDRRGDPRALPRRRGPEAARPSRRPGAGHPGRGADR